MCLLLLVCTALRIHWCVFWLKPNLPLMPSYLVECWTQKNMICTYILSCEDQKNVPLVETTYIHPTKLGFALCLPYIPPEVEQPASSRLVDLPYVRHVIQNPYANEAHMVFQRLWPTWNYIYLFGNFQRIQWCFYTCQSQNHISSEQCSWSTFVNLSWMGLYGHQTAKPSYLFGTPSEPHHTHTQNQGHQFISECSICIKDTWTMWTCNIYIYIYLA